MNVCPQCGQQNPDIAKFCLACGSPIAAPEPSAEERKLITVLFCDIVGSTAKAENMDPEDVRARLAPYYTRLRTELERFGGTVEKFIGDAVVALFGAPVAHEDDPERAVLAALAICAAISELNEADEWLDLQVRIGVNTGEALIVVGARSSEGEGMASGDVMNTAARLQSAAPVDGIVVGEETYRATRDVIDYREAEPIAAKGKSEPVLVWEVGGIRERERVEAPATALVGRDAELEELDRTWQDVLAEGRPSLFGIVGPAGIGKSRLLDEFGARITGDADVHWGRCLPYGEGITYWPVTEIVKSAAGILQSDDRGTLIAKLDEFIDALPTQDPDELRTIAAALSNVIGIPTTPRGTYAAGEIAQAELHWGLRRTAQLLASDRPTVFVFEDLHWAEPTLIELLEYLADGHEGTPLLVIWTARPEFVQSDAAFAAGAGATRAELEVLPAEAATRLLSELIGDSSLAETEFAEALIENAGGNPLFLEETVRMLKDKGMLDLGRWKEAGERGTLPVPTNLQGLISSRLDRLERPDKELAHDASIAGAVFWAGAVAHLGAKEGGLVKIDPGKGLQTLQQHDFIRANPISSVAGEDEYAFNHILIRDVAYGQVPKGRRVMLHVRFSDWVTKLPSSADEFVEIVAWHLEQACRLSREVARSPIEPPFLVAAGALANCGRRAEQREGMREAHRYYTRALEVLGDEADFLERRLELRLRRGAITMLLGQLKEACEELLEVAGLAHEQGSAAVECEALILLADIDQRQGRPSEARRRLDAARVLAAKVGDSSLQIKVAFISATVTFDFEGEFESAIGALRNAVAIAEEIEDRELRTEGHLRIASLLMNQGHYEDAEEELTRCLRVAREMGSLKVEAEATAWLGGIKYYRGDPEEGKRLGLQAREWLDRTGDSYFHAQNLVWLAAYGLLEGDPARAEAELRDALPVALEIGGWIVIQAYRYLAEALLQQHRLDEARELVEFAARNLPEEDTYARAELLRAQATVSAAAREPAAASTAFTEALRLLEDLRLTVELAETRIALARALRSLGDVTGARTAFQLARGACMEMGLRTLVEQIDRELTEIDEGAGPAGPLVRA
jgi:class 3 adenylate cyclase/tetratricopeptide (TPR) repeat protein